MPTRTSPDCSTRRTNCRQRTVCDPDLFHGVRPLRRDFGLRCNEAPRLDRDDVDLENGVLTIRGTKFSKSRYVPVHPSTQSALQRYAALPGSFVSIYSGFFLSEQLPPDRMEYSMDLCGVSRNWLTQRRRFPRPPLARSSSPTGVSRSSVGIVMASMLSVTCPRFQPTWAMRTSLTLIGI